MPFSVSVGLYYLDITDMKETFKISYMLLVCFCNADWTNKWELGLTRILKKAGELDPFDSRTKMRGSGTIELGSGICKMNGSPRLYIASTSGDEWGNVEFTAYGKFATFGTLKSYSGLTLVARTRHSNYKKDGCSAAGYYARVYQSTGEASFQKEYFHGNGGTVYSRSYRRSIPEFSGGIPANLWVGLKFIVSTIGKNIMMELWMDKGGGGTWELIHSLLDSQGAMPALKDVPAQCHVQSGDPILRRGTNCFLRSDGSLETEVHWKNASIRVIEGLPDPYCFTGIRSGTVCCASSCGTCGGTGCSTRLGGSESCCVGSIKNHKVRSCNNNPPPCLIADPMCITGIRNGAACCASSCGTCGGNGCSTRPGGSESCCTGWIKGYTERLCDSYPPPCLIVNSP